MKLPTEYNISYKSLEQWNKEYEQYDKLKNLIAERDKLLNRLRTLKREGTISYYKKELDLVLKKMEANPLWPAFKVLEENKEKNRAAEKDNDRITHQIYKLESVLSQEEGKAFSRTRRACREECRDCPFFNSSNSIYTGKIVCNISPNGI